jgi:aminodeoxyfutalosine synthase
MLSIADKVIRAERLSFDEGVELYRSNDIVALGRLANRTRERLNGNRAYYNVNRHINYTNVCVIDCQLCQGAYARKPGQEGGYAMQLAEVFRFAEQEYSDSLTEFHIVGGLNPDLAFDYYLDLLHGLKSRFPSVHLKAFTMVELDFFTKITRKPLEWVIEQLHEAGMGSCPGGGAEIFAERARPLIADTRFPERDGLKSRAQFTRWGSGRMRRCCMATSRRWRNAWITWCALRELQDETGGFNCFIPAGIPSEHTVYAHLAHNTGFDDLKTIAVRV